MSENIFGAIFIIVILILVGLFGACMNSTYLSLPSDIREKIKTDRANNFRSIDSQIEYIINEYYKDK